MDFLKKNKKTREIYIDLREANSSGGVSLSKFYKEVVPYDICFRKLIFKKCAEFLCNFAVVVVTGDDFVFSPSFSP